MAERSSTPLQVRMKNEVLAELKIVADEMGTTQVGLVKLCVVSLLRWMKDNNVRKLPDDWARMIEEMDGRKNRYQQKPDAMVSEPPAPYGKRNGHKHGGKAK